MSGKDALAAQLGSPSVDRGTQWKFGEVTSVVGTTVTVMYDGVPIPFVGEQIYCGLPKVGQWVSIAVNGQDRFIVGKRLV